MRYVGADASGRFNELLTQLAQEHQKAVSAVRAEYEQQLNERTGEVVALHAKLSAAAAPLGAGAFAVSAPATLGVAPAFAGRPPGGFPEEDSVILEERSASSEDNLEAPQERGIPTKNNPEAVSQRRREGLPQASKAAGPQLGSPNEEQRTESYGKWPTTPNSTSAGGAPGVLSTDSTSRRIEGLVLRPAWERSMAATWGTTLDIFMWREDPRGAEHMPRRGAIRRSGSLARKSIRWWPKTFIISPNGTFRLSWDVTGAVLIAYDVLMIPFTQAFRPKSTVFTVAVDWLALLFWTADMLQAPFVGIYSKGGRYITSHRWLLFHYLRTWFVVDLIVVGPELLTKAVGSGDSSGSLGRMFKSIRGFRVLRLLRLAKLQRLINCLYDMLESEYTFTMVNLAKLLVSVGVLNHVIACLWFWIGNTCMQESIRNWIEEAKAEFEDLPYQYTTSLHWSMTQFTPASMDISARNVWERIFSIVVLFFAMVAFSSIVASITGAMTSLRNMKGDEMKQFWLLRRYLKQLHVSKDLAARIFKFLEHQSEKQNALVQASSIKVLGGLSEELTMELAYHMHSPEIKVHPFFQYLNDELDVVMFRMCGAVIKLRSYAEQDVIFTGGEEAKAMFFIKSGVLCYTRGNLELSPSPQTREWASEAVLWCQWRHRGMLRATSAAELVVVDSAKFVDMMAVHPRPWFYARQYGLAFVVMVNELHVDSLSDFLRDEEFYENASMRASRLGYEEAVQNLNRKGVNCISEGEQSEGESRPHHAERRTSFEAGGN